MKNQLNIRMRRKIIDDYCLQYMNDLFRIKLIFYDPSSMLHLSKFVWTRYVLRHGSFLTIFSLQTQQIDIRLVAIKSAYFST